MRDWQDKLDQFLQFNDREVLQGAGKISKKMADEKAQAEYVQFAEQQRRLKEAEGEKDIAGLLQWNKESKKVARNPPNAIRKTIWGYLWGYSFIKFKI